MRLVKHQNDEIWINEYQDALKCIQRLSRAFEGDVTPVSRGGKGRNRIEYFNYPCSFDIETTTIKPGELDYAYDPEAPPIAFPYLFQWNIYGSVIMCRTYSEAVQIFAWLSEYFRLGGNRKMIIFDHNLSYEYGFWKDLWKVIPDRCFALDGHHPVTICTEDGFVFRDSYKMTNMSLETLTKDWSPKWKKDKELIDYSELRTPYTELTDNVYVYSALDVLSLSDAIEPFLQARDERIWTKCPTSTSFIRKDLKKEIGVGVKKRTPQQHNYFKVLEWQKIDADIYKMLMRLARGGNTHANRAITGQLLRNVCHFDITSSYPAQMVCYPEFPIGEWMDLEPGTEMDTIELFERNGLCTMFDLVLDAPRLKKGVPVPYISTSKMTILKGSGMIATDNGRYMDGLDRIRITIFGMEWPIIKAQYDFDDAVLLRGYFCRKGYLPDIIRNFVLKFYAKKTELKNVQGQEIEYMLNKIGCNSIFGLCYTNPYRDLWQITQEGIILKDPEDLSEFLEKYQKSISYFTCYSWGCAVACLGRIFLQRMIDACNIYDDDGNIIGSDFCYCDTDSIFALHPEVVRPKIRALEEEIKAFQRQCGLELTYYDIKGRPHELGGIDEEPMCDFRTYGAKKYATVEDGELKCTIAGVPKKAGGRIIGSLENFRLGLNFKGSETGKQCLWHNEAPDFKIHDEQGREIEIHSNVAMLPVDYLLSISPDYTECLSVEGNFHWNFKEADKNVINEEDY